MLAQGDSGIKLSDNHLCMANCSAENEAEELFSYVFDKAGIDRPGGGISVTYELCGQPGLVTATRAAMSWLSFARPLLRAET